MKIRLGTFNLFQFVEPPYSWYVKKDKFTQEQWSKKTSWIKEQITHMNCDIIGFQEVFSASALKELVNELGFKYFETVEQARTDKKNPHVYVTTTVAIASKYPITNILHVEPNITSIKKHNFKGFFKFAREPLKVKIALENNQEILVYICHLKSNWQNEFEYIFTQNDTLVHKKEVVNKALQ
ncbi:MAG: endonuclease, partial [Campylobacteraceae bacterium]|nr:endonuclease [Campylobacteraceae bacterium]